MPPSLCVSSGSAPFTNRHRSVVLLTRLRQIQTARTIAIRSQAAHPCHMRRDVELGRPSFIDVLDRVLDKGIVIDGWGRVAVAGIDLISVDAWVVVASIHTYLRYADSLGLSPRVPTTAPLGDVPLDVPLSEIGAI
jgi:hypothetical protein